MSRLSAFVAAVFCLLAVTARAQDTPPTGPAAATHAGVKLAFPQSLGGATLVVGESFGNGAVSYGYSAGNNKIQIVVFIYDNGRRVPVGSETPQLLAEFASDVSKSEAQIKAGGYTNFQRPPVPSSCLYGSTSFRCLVFSASAPSGRLFSKLLMTGYNGYFLKIQANWALSTGATQADADSALQSFITALIH